MQISYAIENIRRLSRVPEIEMRPITILVGRNSAGKSTFLRSLPLIRQSLETRSSAPILWFGDLVDFGDPTTAIGEGKEVKQAAFSFSVSGIQERYFPRYYDHTGYYTVPESVEVRRVWIRYVIGTRGDETVLESIQIRIPDEKIDVSFDIGSQEESFGQIRINGVPADFLTEGYEVRTMDRSLFAPPIVTVKTVEKEGKSRRVPRRQNVLAEALADVFRRQTTRHLSDARFQHEVRRVLSKSPFDDQRIERLMQTSGTATFREIYQRLLSDEESDFVTEVFSIQRLSRVCVVLDVLGDRLSEYFLNVGYLGPVRAASERYYRRQELEVSEIAPNGSNFPMFLASLTRPELESFSRWVEGIFSYGVRVRRTSGHISIELVSQGRSVNVTDTGYGVSQILPVLGMLWWAVNHPPRTTHWRRPRRVGVRTLAIEQPELHLHPAHQAKLADVFASTVGNSDGRSSSARRLGIRLVVETHSEALINRLGELVEEGKVDAGAIQIVVFSADEDLASATKVSLSRFDDSGALSDWPYGFFKYSE